MITSCHLEVVPVRFFCFGTIEYRIPKNSDIFSFFFRNLNWNSSCEIRLIPNPSIGGILMVPIAGILLSRLQIRSLLTRTVQPVGSASSTESRSEGA